MSFANGTVFVIFSFKKEKYIFLRDQYFKRKTSQSTEKFDATL